MPTAKQDILNKRQALAYAMEAWQKADPLVGFELVYPKTGHYNKGARYMYVAARGWRVYLKEDGTLVDVHKSR